MTKKQRIARIIDDIHIPLGEKVAGYIISLPPTKLGALKTTKLEKVFETPIATLDTHFLHYQKRSIEKYILFYKMQTAYDLITNPIGKRPKFKIISKRLGFNKYTDFLYQFKKHIIATPRQLKQATQNRKNSTPDNENQTPATMEIFESTPQGQPGLQNE